MNYPKLTALGLGVALLLGSTDSLSQGIDNKTFIGELKRIKGAVCSILDSEDEINSTKMVRGKPAYVGRTRHIISSRTEGDKIVFKNELINLDNKVTIIEQTMEVNPETGRFESIFGTENPAEIEKWGNVSLSADQFLLIVKILIKPENRDGYSCWRVQR